MTLVDGLPLVEVSASAVLVVVFFMVVTGRLMTRKAHDEIVSFYQAALTERSEQIAKLLDSQDTSTRFVESVVEVAGVRKDAT